MNKIFLIGNLTKDPITSVTHSGIKACNFSIAVSDGKDKDGNQTAQYYNCTAFDKQADLLQKYVKKGHKIAVVGRGKTDSYDNKDGVKMYAFKVIASEIELLTSKKDAESNPAPEVTREQILNNANAKVKDDDLPEIDVSKINVQLPF